MIKKKDFLYKYYYREILSYYYLFPFRKKLFLQQSYLIILFIKVFFFISQSVQGSSLWSTIVVKTIGI